MGSPPGPSTAAPGPRSRQRRRHRRKGRRPAQPSKTIIRFWDNGHPPPALVERMEDWRRFNPGWTYELHDTPSAAAYLGREFGWDARDAFLDVRMPSMKSDVFRIGRLLRGAGLWVDAGTICRAPLRSWLNRKDGMVFLRKPGMEPPRIWNGVAYVHRAGHPALEAMWEHVQRLILAREGQEIWRDFGPGLFNRVLQATGAIDRVRVIHQHDLNGMVEYGSSIHFLPVETHWSIRQRQGESLYFSQLPHPDPGA